MKEIWLYELAQKQFLVITGSIIPLIFFPIILMDAVDRLIVVTNLKVTTPIRIEKLVLGMDHS